MPQTDFLTLYQRRLAKLSPTYATCFMDCSRVATLPYFTPSRHARSRQWGQIDVVVPDLCLVLPFDRHAPENVLLVEKVVQYCQEAGIPFNRSRRSFMLRLTPSTGRRRWKNRWQLNILSFANSGEQVTLKLMFPELR
jgi:hypothetical protein